MALQAAEAPPAPPPPAPPAPPAGGDGGSSQTPSPASSPGGGAPQPPDPNQNQDDDERRDQAGRSRIVNGVPADPKMYPWIAAIGARDQDGNVKAYCAGTLIDRNWLLTAAHCKVLDGDYAVVGRSDLASKMGHVIKIKHMVTHKQYDRNTLDYDIALAQLDTPVNDIVPVALPAPCDLAPPAGPSGTAWSGTPTEDCEGSVRSAGNLSIAGWGRLGEAVYRTPNVLQKADVMISSRKTCTGNYAAVQKVITANMFCAQGRNAQGLVTDACQGDSGGPIVGHNRVNPARVVLVGVISKGQGCAQLAYPGVYAKLPVLMKWVDRCMNHPDDAACS